MPAGTLIVGRCWSTAGVSAKFVQSLVAFASGGISPVQVTVIVCPTAEGTVIVLVAGLDAQLNTASEAPMAQRKNVKRRRELKTPELEVDLMRIVGSFPESGLDWDLKLYSERQPRCGCLHFCNATPRKMSE